jgi:enoyl reductase-like protein
MRREGLPIKAFCVATSILSTNKAVTITGGLQPAGICHRSLKSGLSDSIRRVISITAADPTSRWSLHGLRAGGCATGHCSCKDFYQPVPQTYGSSRKCFNLIDDPCRRLRLWWCRRYPSIRPLGTRRVDRHLRRQVMEDVRL